MATLKPGLLAAAALLFALALAEGLLRLAAPQRLRDSDPLRVRIIPIGTLGYAPRPGAVFRYRNGTRATINRLGYRGPEVAVHKPAGAFRIMLLGGSTTQGWAVDDTGTLDAHLRRELPGAEVLNLAFDGYDAFQVMLRFEAEGPRYRPDVVVLNVGINDVRNARIPNLRPRDERAVLWLATLRRLEAERLNRGPSPWTRAKHLTYLARLPGLVRELRARPSSGPVPPAATHDAARLFREYVGATVGRARALGAAVVLVTPPSYLASPVGALYSPRAYWLATPAETQRYRDLLAGELRALADSAHAAYLHPELPAAHFLDDCHPTSAGYARLAREIAAVIRPVRASGPAASGSAAPAAPPPPRPRRTEARDAPATAAPRPRT